MNNRQKVAFRDFISNMKDSLIVLFVFACIICFAFSGVFFLYGIQIPMIMKIGSIFFILIFLFYIFEFVYCALYRFFVIYNLEEEDYKKYLFDKSVPESISNTKRYKLYKFFKK